MNEQRTTVDEAELHAYVDGQLSFDRRAAVERALQADPALVARVDAYLAQKHWLHARYDDVLEEPVPHRLRPGDAPRAAWPRWMAMAAMLVLGIGIGIGMDVGGLPGALVASREGKIARAGGEAPAGFARQAALAHVVYMPDVVRPATLGADREQDFVQWLSDRLGTAVHPPVLTRSGFELVGGRLLPDAGGDVAQFMYRDAGGQRITLCISRRKADSKTTAFRLYQDGSVNVFYWIDGDFGYAVSGGIGRDVLLELSHDVHAQLEGARGR